MARREATYRANLAIQQHLNQGRIFEAEKEFIAASGRNIFSWNILITGLLRKRLIDRATFAFEKMPQRNAVSWTALFQTYAGQGYLLQAEEVFNAMPERDCVSWTSIITAFGREGHVEKAKHYFDSSTHKDITTWTSLVVANAKAGQLADVYVVLNKMPYQNVHAWNVALLAKVRLCGVFREDFDQLPERSCVSWSTLLSGYAESGNLLEAKRVFELMPCHELCSSTSMITAYAKAGDLESAEIAFESLEMKDPVLWAAMLGAYAQNGQCRKAVAFFRRMDVEGSGCFFDSCIFVTVLDACADISDLSMGKILHEEFSITGLDLRPSDVATNALVNFYGRCGKLDLAKRFFNYTIGRRNNVTWNTMITVYSQNGEILGATDAFQEMVLEGMEPNGVTFLSLLLCCSHGGLFSKGIDYMLVGISDFEVEPMLDHYVCIVDLLCKLGRVDEVKGLIENMPFEPNEVAHHALLGAYKLHAS